MYEKIFVLYKILVTSVIKCTYKTVQNHISNHMVQVVLFQKCDASVLCYHLLMPLFNGMSY